MKDHERLLDRKLYSALTFLQEAEQLAAIRELPIDDSEAALLRLLEESLRRLAALPRLRGRHTDPDPRGISRRLRP